MDAMDYIDPALIAAADAPAPRRGGRGWARYGLIAACLCLTLAGTAVAAQYFGVRIIDGAGGDEGVDFWVEGGIVYYPVDRLSDELRALENEHTYRSFDSWQEAEAFIGVDLINNPVLDASPATNFSVRYVEEHGIDIRGQFVLSTSVGLSSVRLDGCYEMGDVDLTVEAQLYTNRMTEKAPDWDERFYGLTFSEGTETSQEFYTAANGLEAQILEINRPHKDTCLAACSLNGVPILVKAHSDNGLEEAREALYQVLDGFELN